MSSQPTLLELHALREELSSIELDQGHIFKDWPNHPLDYSADQVALLSELYQFQSCYPGGVQKYIRTGRHLLNAESEEANTLAQLEMPPLLYHSPSLLQQSEALAQLESQGMQLLKKTVFVLVAGGLGERLGYPGIKTGLPVETATWTTYLEHYIDWARRVSGCWDEVPFVIMTSDDTHERTVELLKQLQYSGMRNLRLLKQETVLCFTDSAAHLATDAEGKLLRKPHGHGDVHSLIYRAMEKAEALSGPTGSDVDTAPAASSSSSAVSARASPTSSSLALSASGGISLVDSWIRKGYEYITFFQDTNAPATLTTPISLAISEREQLDMNFTCIPRLPKEAIGLLCHTMKDSGAPWHTCNVEYNVFEVVAKTLTKEGGDVAAQGSEYSAFPGSINTLLFKLSSYQKLLASSHGSVPEFINPKYADRTRRAFKKPARVESLMQDFALLYKEGRHRVGGTVFERFLYQPVKNSLAEAARKVADEGISACCALTGEADFYELMRRRIKAVGVPLVYDMEPQVRLHGAEEQLYAHIFPIIVLDAAAGRHASLEELARVFPNPLCVHISPSSSLIIEGRVVIESLTLDGHLQVCGPAWHSDAETISTAPPALVIRDMDVRNDAWSVRVISPEEAEGLREADLIRGFVLEKTAGKTIMSSPSSASPEPAKL